MTNTAQESVRRAEGTGAGTGTRSGTPMPPTPIGLTVTQALALPALAGARIVAGHAGRDRVVERVNVMEVPDILPWVKPKELLLTTGYPLRHSPSPLTDLIADLDRAGLSAIAIKPHRYLGGLPPELLAAADGLGFPVIELPEGVAFDEILTDVLSDILDRQSAVLARVDHVHRTLAQIALEGGGLAELTAELANILGGPVLVTTPDGRVLAESGAEAVRHLPCFDSPAGREADPADHRLRTEAEQSGLTSHHGTQHALVPIVAGRVDHGRLVAFAGRRAFDASDVAALERAATVAALAVVKQLAVAAVEDKYRADFLRDLLTGRLEDPQSAAAHAATLGWDIDPSRAPSTSVNGNAGTADPRRLVVLVAELDPGQSVLPASQHALRPARERFAAAWQNVVASSRPYESGGRLQPGGGRRPEDRRRPRSPGQKPDRGGLGHRRRRTPHVLHRRLPPRRDRRRPAGRLRGSPPRGPHRPPSQRPRLGRALRRPRRLPPALPGPRPRRAPRLRPPDAQRTGRRRRSRR